LRGKIKPKTRTNVTLSLDKDIYDLIFQEATSEGLSVNAKINSILTKNIIFYRRIDDVGCITVMPETVSFFLKNTNEKEIIKSLEVHLLKEIHSFFRMNNIQPNLQNIIDHLFQRIALWSGYYNSFNYDIDEHYIRINLRHRYGINWSRIIEKIFSRILFSFHFKSNSDILDNMVIMKVAIDTTMDVL
jgi:hypothetical protein